jgi:hypothetical protein
MRSAIARPMPREEPVMTATFPVMSNKVINSSQMFRLRRLLPDQSWHSQALARNCVLRAWTQASLLVVTSGPAG